MESTESTQPVILTNKAVDKVKDFMQTNEEGSLRLGVRGGGCSGFQYTLALDYSKEGDIIYQQEDIEIAIDRASLPYLQGSTLDYVETLEEQGFSFKNPNATSACGCGSSFRMDNKAGCDSAGYTYDNYDDVYFGDEESAV